MKYVLGIETSCDETAAAVVVNGFDVRSNIIATSLKDHQMYGGVIPEIASRRQLEYIPLVVMRALEAAKIELKTIDAIAVTRRPGLLGSLLVGISYARALSFAIKKPLIDVDHIYAHVYANFLQLRNDQGILISKKSPQLPAIGVVVSGGHSSLFYMKSSKDFRLIGQTRDDAIGEAFDKVAKILKLGYPGGPIIDRLSNTVKETNIEFPKVNLQNTLDLSFSGLKTAVLYYVQKHQNQADFQVDQVAHAFQKSAVEAIVTKTLIAAQRYETSTILVGGGVAANSFLRQTLTEQAQEKGIEVYFPPMSLCLDNAAMIAGLGYQWMKL